VLLTTSFLTKEGASRSIDPPPQNPPPSPKSSAELTSENKTTPLGLTIERAISPPLADPPYTSTASYRERRQWVLFFPESPLASRSTSAPGRDMAEGRGSEEGRRRSVVLVGWRHGEQWQSQDQKVVMSSFKMLQKV
jgi:hypothetical protein